MSAISAKDRAKADRIIKEYDAQLAAAWKQHTRSGVIPEVCALIVPDEEVSFGVRPLSEVVKMLDKLGEREAAEALRRTDRVPGHLPFLLRFLSGFEMATMLGWYVPDAELS